MKVRELRIGNYVDYEKTSHMITGIDINGTVSSKWVRGKGDEYYHHGVDDIDGIPLTPEILEKAGFVEKIGLMAWELEGVVIVYEILAGFFRLYPRTNPIKYVHQLQNLYFALTGEELTINL